MQAPSAVVRVIINELIRSGRRESKEERKNTDSDRV